MNYPQQAAGYLEISIFEYRNDTKMRLDFSYSILNHTIGNDPLSVFKRCVEGQIDYYSIESAKGS